MEEAEPCFQQALDLARQQGPKSLELRAAMSLGPSFHFCPVPFAFPQEARVLLEALSVV